MPQPYRKRFVSGHDFSRAAKSLKHASASAPEVSFLAVAACRTSAGEVLRAKIDLGWYMHRNPVVRRLVSSPEDWRWGSYRSYAYAEVGLVRINDWTWWQEKIRRTAG